MNTEDIARYGAMAFNKSIKDLRVSSIILGPFNSKDIFGELDTGNNGMIIHGKVSMNLQAN